MRRALALLLLLLLPAPALAWGRQAHRVVATLASQRLTPQARAAVEELLRDNEDGRSLAAISMWADWVRYRKLPETYNWHFVNIPLERERYDSGRDCRPERGKGDCIVAALARTRDTLADPRRRRAERVEALKFVVHLVADLHQPLHTAERDGDEGATRVEVSWLGSRETRGRKRRSWTLHGVWDDGLLAASDRSNAQIVVDLNAWLAQQDEHALAAGSIVDWTLEAHRVAREQAYRDADGGSIPLRGASLGRDYYEARIAVVERQLALAGVRLARLLNEAL